MKIAITGGKGFQGKALVARLDAEGHATEVFDLPEYDLRQRAPNLMGFDCVFHLAARVGGTKETHGAADAEIMLDNLAIDRNVIEAAVTGEVKRFVLASSAAVYPLAIQKEYPSVLKETDWLDSTDLESGYGVAKLAAEAALFRLHRTGRIPSLCVLRLFNVYGPGDVSSHVIPDIIKKFLEDKQVRLYGDGYETRAFVFVDDVVEAYMKALSTDNAGPFNVGGDEPVTVKGLAAMIRRASGSVKPIWFDGKAQPGAVSSIPSINYAKAVLGWEPKVSLEDGLQRTVDWRKSL